MPGVATLDYAEPQPATVMPGSWIWKATLAWAVAFVLERAATWWIIAPALPRSAFHHSFRDWVDFVLSHVIAFAVLCELLRTRRRSARGLTRLTVALCAAAVAVAMTSIIVWTWQLLPRVYSRRGVADAVVWEAELVLRRLLPVSWPLIAMIFAWRGAPTRRGAAAVLTFWASAILLCAIVATAALVNQRGLRALSPDLWGYTVMPIWMPLILIVTLMAVMQWVGPLRPGRWLTILAAAAWLAAVMLHVYHDERMSGVSHWESLGKFLQPKNLSHVAAELLDTLLVWQVAPTALLLFIAGVAGGGVDVRGAVTVDDES